MKYGIITIVAFLFISCGPAYKANKAEKNFKGEWILKSVSFPNSSGFFDVELFDVANTTCFENSVWNFVPNNSTGNFILDGNNCSKTEQEFVWYVDKTTVQNINKEILFKITTGRKAKAVDRGVRIKIKSLLANRMVWEQTVMFKGKQINIEISFSKL